jgi:hypothetical protein
MSKCVFSNQVVKLFTVTTVNIKILKQTLYKCIYDIHVE